MEKQKLSFTEKFLIILFIIVICIGGYFMILLPLNLRGEGDPYFVFSEVPVEITANSMIIHLKDEDIMNIRGLDVKIENGKISRIYFRNPEINQQGFIQKYGIDPYDISSRRYLEYKGVYYYAEYRLP
jgi:hypothetical protein